MAKSALHRYFKEIQQNLNCSEKEKRKFIGDFENSVNGYLADNPHATHADIVRNFGDPQEIAQSFLQEEDFEDVQQKIKLKKRIIRIVSLAIIVLVAVAIVLGGIFVVDTLFFNHGQYDVSIGTGTRPSNSKIVQTY